MSPYTVATADVMCVLQHHHTIVMQAARFMSRGCCIMCTGTGSTLVCDVLSGPKLDFGSQFVGRGWQLEVVVANLGRRATSLAWSNTKLEELLKTYSKKARGTGTCRYGHIVSAVMCSAALVWLVFNNKSAFPLQVNLLNNLLFWCWQAKALGH